MFIRRPQHPATNQIDDAAQRRERQAEAAERRQTAQQPARLPAAGLPPTRTPPGVRPPPPPAHAAAAAADLAAATRNEDYAYALQLAEVQRLSLTEHDAQKARQLDKDIRLALMFNNPPMELRDQINNVELVHPRLSRAHQQFMEDDHMNAAEHESSNPCLLFRHLVASWSTAPKPMTELLRDLDESWLRCPITLTRFTDPVLAVDGHTYERRAILTYLQDARCSPMTREAMSSRSLIPHGPLRQLLADYLPPEAD